MGPISREVFLGGWKVCSYPQEPLVITSLTTHHLHIMQISNNGIISFRVPFNSFNPAPFPNGVSIIAPFWGDVDTRESHETPPVGVPRDEINKVWFREEFDTEQLEKARLEVQEAFIGLSTFTPTSLFIATWSNVGYYRIHIDKVSSDCCYRKTINF